MIAVLGGLAAAALFAAATVAASRGARMIGAQSFVAGVMVVGLAITLPLTLAGGKPAGLDAHTFGWLAISGVGNVAGLLLDYACASARQARAGRADPLHRGSDRSLDRSRRR